jgi:flagellar biosynthesis/type III secretory pathway protein FliH
VEEGELHQFLGTFEEWLESDKEKVDESPAPRKPRPARQRPPQGNKGPSPAAEERMIRIIDGLETHLQEIQSELEEASEQGNWEALLSIGLDYDRTKAELDEKLAQWGG